MTISRIATITLISLASATGAFAQKASSRPPLLVPPPSTLEADALDPVTRAAVLARRGFWTPVETPIGVVRPVQEQVYYRAAPAPQQAAAPVVEAAPKMSRFEAALRGISQSLQVSHEALDVYEHAVEANALKNTFSVR